MAFINAIDGDNIINMRDFLLDTPQDIISKNGIITDRLPNKNNSDVHKLLLCVQ